MNEVAEGLARRFREALPAGIDGVYAFTHPYGCSQLGDDHLNTQKILAGLAQHPNAAGVLWVGLGCESNTMEGIRRRIGDDDPGRCRYLISQDESDEFSAGLQRLEELAALAGRARRQPVPIARLRVGMKCGGSDGFSASRQIRSSGRSATSWSPRGATAALDRGARDVRGRSRSS